jgi:hypothetical protein
MKQFMSTVEWSLFLQTVWWLFLLYLVVRNLPMVFRVLGGSESDNRKLLRASGSIRIAFELIAIVLLIELFLRIDLVTHGLILGVFAVVAWTPARNYLSGSYIRLSTDLRVGQKIAYIGEEAIIQHIGPFNITLQMAEGTRVVEYHNLRSNGLTLISGTQRGNYLELTLSRETEKEENSLSLSELMLNCPYLDWAHHPEIAPNESFDSAVNIKVFLIDDKYTQGFIALVREWGFTVIQPAKK